MAGKLWCLEHFVERFYERTGVNPEVVTTQDIHEIAKGWVEAIKAGGSDDVSYIGPEDATKESSKGRAKDRWSVQYRGLEYVVVHCTKWNLLVTIVYRALLARPRESVTRNKKSRARGGTYKRRGREDKWK